jgi:hypothetical protein
MRTRAPSGSGSAVSIKMPPAETLRATQEMSPKRMDSTRTGNTLSNRRCCRFSPGDGTGAGEALVVSLMRPN